MSLLSVFPRFLSVCMAFIQVPLIGASSHFWSFLVQYRYGLNKAWNVFPSLDQGVDIFYEYKNNLEIFFSS